MSRGPEATRQRGNEAQSEQPAISVIFNLLIEIRRIVVRHSDRTILSHIICAYARTIHRAFSFGPLALWTFGPSLRLQWKRPARHKIRILPCFVESFFYFHGFLLFPEFL